MKQVVSFYNYTFLILSVLMLVFCVYSLYSKPVDNAIDFTVIDTKSIAKLEPSFLKKLDEEIPLPEPEPMYESEDNGTIICGGWSERIVFNAVKLSNKDLLQKVDKIIDSIRLNDLERRVHINIVSSKETPYQTFIDVLDLFYKKNSRIYGLHKETIFWIE
ncbi:hypothetical protein SAMN05421741_12716 [Paenimyroides ummariense]|uniref:Uncharacterized protein n=1 Tax=Paenimyroides ummariense TaxID=913024 RepID=A0A1I5FDY7_9FLAO|nr:hypothetical protein [Paenimyroides ummariense]SFO21920.1 hypothetical protein SAMN05421741_12716 [Paenimyroides ummariense]